MAGPTSQNQYTPQAVPLDGGLDLITPKVAVNGGTLSECYNFERTDRNGYSRIFGYEYFDGSASSSLAYTNSAYIVHDSNAGSYPVKTVLRIVGNDDVLGIVIAKTSTKTLIAISDFDEWRQILAAVNFGNTIDVQDVNATYAVLTVTSIQSFEEGYTPTGDAKALTLAKNNYFKSLNGTIQYPGFPSNPIIGLRGFKDHVYAIKDLQTVYFSSGSEQIFPNATIRRTGGTADNDIYVANVRLLDGTWAGGDAEGILEIVPSSGYTNTTYDLINPVDNTVLSSDVLSFSSPPPGQDMSATAAGMWKSRLFTESPYTGGWDAVRLGFQVNFEDGTIYGPPHISRRGVFSDYTTDVTTASGHGTTGSSTDGAGVGGATTTTWVITPTGNVPASVNNETGTVNNARATMAGTLPATNLGHLDLGAVDIPDFSNNTSANIKGVEVQIRMTQGGPVGFEGYVTLDAELQTSGSLLAGSQARSQIVTSGSGTFTFGGPTDLWGVADGETLRALLDPTTFGLKLTPAMTPLNSTQTWSNILRMFDVKIVVYFTQTISQYYFYDGVDDVTADITYQYVTSTTDGGWEEGASGVLQVTNIQPAGAATRNYIKDGDEIWTGPLGTGLQIATISSDMTYNGLDTLADIEEAESRYIMIVANFFADESFEAIYGVSGAGRAFSYDGFYFTRIFTQADGNKDTPRHIAPYQFHLALGYRAGAALLSVAGNPLDFLGENGATEVDTGDPIVGFARMQGTTLGIFCKESIQGLVGTSADNFSLSVLGPYEGAIEYTVCNIGEHVVFCSYRGISFFEQTAAYGDFSGSRLSYTVTPFLVPRLNGATNPLGVAATTSGPVVAIACRTKNQYRLYFGDGYRLTMTLVGPEQTPHFTKQADILFDSEGAFAGYFVPRAESSFVDSSGAERIHLAHYSKSVPLNEYHAYEMEKSWTYGGIGIPAYLICNENFFGSPFNYDVARKLRLHGLSLGYAPISVHIDRDYGANGDQLYPGREVPNVSLPAKPAATLGYDYNPVTSMGYLSSRARSFSMRFMSYDTESQPSYTRDPVYADVCPPFVLQAMLVQHTENKGDT